jgi:hypothetical protein
VHWAVVVQQAPVGGGQGSGVQTELSPCQAPPAPMQSASREIAQVPSARQQAPRGCSQGFVGVQATFAPSQTLGETQTACWVEVQTPLGMQQAPCGCGQLLGTQRVAGPPQLFGLAQSS